MKQQTRFRCLAWLAILAFIAVVFALGAYLHIILAVLFVAGVLVGAYVHWKDEGFWKGVKYFIKEILFGW